jgi:hypothetical protein
LRDAWWLRAAVGSRSSSKAAQRRHDGGVLGAHYSMWHCYGLTSIGRLLVWCCVWGTRPLHLMAATDNLPIGFVCCIGNGGCDKAPDPSGNLGRPRCRRWILVSVPFLKTVMWIFRSTFPLGAPCESPSSRFARAGDVEVFRRSALGASPFEPQTSARYVSLVTSRRHFLVGERGGSWGNGPSR